MDQEELKQQLQNLLDQAKAKFKELDDEYQSFISLRDELRGKISSIKALNTKSESQSNQLEGLLNTGKEAEESLINTKNKVESIISEINNYFETFKDIRTQLTDPENGLDIIFNWLQQKRDESSAKYEEVVRLQADTMKLKARAEEDVADIEKSKEDSQNLKKEIQKWLELVSDSARFDEFSKRKKQLQTESYVWLAITVLGFFSLAFFVYIIFVKHPFVDLLSSINKFFYTTPIIILIIWSTRNYSEIRLYLEKYSYKAIMSVSLSSYLELLESKFGNEGEELIKLAFDSIRKIFREPYKDKDRKLVFNLFGKVVFEDSEKTLGSSEENNSG